MPIINYAGIAILAILFSSQFNKSRINLTLLSRRAFWFSVIVIASMLSYYSYAQYSIWQGNELTQLFFSDGPRYFLGYVTHRFWAQYLVSFVVALIFLLTSQKFNKRRGGKFFYPEEPYILALGIFLVGHPLWIAYILEIIVLYALFSVFYNWYYHLSARKKQIDTTSKPKPRISFYYGWLPTALLVILMKGVLATVPFLKVLVFSSGHLIL